MKILIIEDDPDLSIQLCGLLNDCDFETLSAKDEKEAIDVITKENMDISIAIIDMFLPPVEQKFDFKESGLRLVRFIEEKYPTIISIVHTGNSDHTNAALCIEAGAFSYIEKGGEPKLLLETIKRASIRYKDKVQEQIMKKFLKELPEKIEKVNQSINILFEQTEDFHSFIERVMDELELDNKEK
jgi:DNA-binding NtrC family response regulator